MQKQRWNASEPVALQRDPITGSSEPPMRDIDGYLTAVHVRSVPKMHLLTAAGANAEPASNNRLPPPEHLLLTRMTESKVAEMIERHIEYVDKDDRPVRLPIVFVRNYMQRTDGALPTVVGITTVPLILGDGTIMSGRGLDKKRGIVFRVQPELEALLPRANECDAMAVSNAYRYLIDEWLVDVATDANGKAVIIAYALSLIERALLPDRPCFVITAGRRGGGKTTTLIMVLMAITGLRPAAAAWSTNEEERRKAIMSYLLEGVATIIWDNIRRGEQISCQHIEKACTAAYYADRILGVSQTGAPSAATIMCFTGNNIGLSGDLASRGLVARLQVERPDPENRKFKHPDPIAWTEANRGNILRALFTVLLGNPRLKDPNAGDPKTRFKTWWHLVGSAIEHASRLAKNAVDFSELFLLQEEDEEESASLADALEAMNGEWAGHEDTKRATTFTAALVAKLINNIGDAAGDTQKQRKEILREFLFPNAKSDHVANTKAIGKRLKRHVGEPVFHGNQILSLMVAPHKDGAPAKDALQFYVRPQQRKAASTDTDDPEKWET